MIRYTPDLDGITAERLQGGFFVGWPNPPSPEMHLRILQNAYRVVLAVDDAAENQPVIGFINAISDGVLAAFIPLLEVLPTYQGQGIGTELTRRMLEALQPLYAVDLLCDESLIPFYQRLGLIPATGAACRNYAMQSGCPITNAVLTDLGDHE